MKKLVISVLLSLLTIEVFCFDYNKDNFSVILDEETALFVYKDKIYILGYDGQLWSDSRPKKITNNYGYSMVNMKENPYYGSLSKEFKGIYFLDLNGDIIAVEYYGNEKQDKQWDDLYMDVYAGLKSIKASSELTETINNVTTVYSVKNVLTLGTEKESPYFFRPLGKPWVPDIKKDKNPYIDFELQYEKSTIHILPGFVDFERQHLWKQNARPKTIELIDLETSESLGKYKIKDSINFTSIDLPREVKKVRVKFLDFYPGTKYQDPCVAAIYFGTDEWPRKDDYGESSFREDGYFIQKLKQQK